MSLDDLAKFVGEDWHRSPYYDNVETYSSVQWKNRILPFIGDTPIDYSVSMDLAAGHGRNSAQLLKHCRHLHNLREFKRVLRPGGHGFLHHSNYTKNPGGDLHKNPGWRNFMSDALFAHYAVKEGLIVLRQQIVDWKKDETFIDCFSLIANPTD